jgi:hypothetical protein
MRPRGDVKPCGVWPCGTMCHVGAICAICWGAGRLCPAKLGFLTIQRETARRIAQFELAPRLLDLVRMRCKSAGLAILLSLFACGDDDGDGGSSADAAPETDASDDGNGDGGTDASPDGDASVGELPVHVIHPWCGPADQPAVRIALGQEDAQNDCAVDESATSVQLDVWTLEIEAPVTFSFSPNEAMASGALCPGAPAQCRSFLYGDIHFDTYEEGSAATGTWRLLGEDEEDSVNGTFEARWCEPDPPVPCG